MSLPNLSLPSEAMTAAQRALGIAEILGSVISFIPRESLEAETDLISCALVNKFWRDEVLPMIWRDCYLHTMEKVLLKLKPERRQFFANLIFHGTTGTIYHKLEGRKDVWATGGPLDGIVFPKMVSLEILHREFEYGERSLPSLNCPNLQEMNFGGTMPEYFECEDGMGASGWESIFWDLPTKFPSLQRLTFDFRPNVFPNAIQRLKKHHPNLRDSLDELKVFEITHYERETMSDDASGFDELQSPDEDEDFDSDEEN